MILYKQNRIDTPRVSIQEGGKMVLTNVISMQEGFITLRSGQYIYDIQLPPNESIRMIDDTTLEIVDIECMERK